MPSKNLSNSVWIVAGLRTIIGNPYKSLKKYTAVELASQVINVLLHKSHIKNDAVDEVIIGNTVSAGIGQNLARQAALIAGLPPQTTAYTVNSVCGSSLQSVILGAQAIVAQSSRLVVAGGAESATHSPYIVKREDIIEKKEDAELLDSLFHDGLYCRLSGKSMGELIEALAKKHHITRQEQDTFSLRSHRLACQAQEKHKFDHEIVPMGALSKGTPPRDDRPRRNIKLESLQSLYPAFSEIGSVTAGNSSAPCDAAAVLLLASKEFVRQNKLKPRGKMIGYASAAVNPEDVFESATVAIQECLKVCQLKLDEIDLFEIGEAFASQVLIVQKQLHIPDEKLNIYGGDIAFGHPLGAAGARILVTLVNALHNEGKSKGLACISFGGGGAIAIIIEAVK